MKDGAQMQVNMAALALWRNFVLDEGNVGVILFRNLIRKYYPLNDERIRRYENIQSVVSQPMVMPDGKRTFCYPSLLYYITNLSVYKRKGKSFDMGGWKFALSHSDYITNHSFVPNFGKGEIFSEVDSLAIFSDYPLGIVCAKNAYIDSNTCSVVSGFDVKEELKAPEAKINSFRAECDAALSSSNATTMIEIIY